MASHNVLPLDDLELEMEEVEGLVEVSTVGRGKSASRASRTSTVVGAVASCCSSKHRSKWACCTLFILIIVVMALYLTGEQEQGSNDFSDVNAKKHAPKQEYVPPPPTAKPTTRATNPPTASPTKEKSVSLPPEKEASSPPPTALPTAKPNEKKAEAGEPKENGGKEEKGNKDDKKKEDDKKEETKQEPVEQDNVTETLQHLDYSYPPTPFAVRTENPPAPKVMEEYKKKWGTWNLKELPEMDRECLL